MRQAFSPLDEELGLLPNTAYTPHLQEGLGRLGTALPFRQAQAHFQFFTGVVISEASVRRLTLKAGQAAVTVEIQQVEMLQKEAEAAPAGPDLAYLSADGCFVATVGGEWKEVKTLVIGEVERPVAVAEQVVVKTGHLSYFSRCLPIEEFKQASIGEVQRRGLENAKTVCAPSDGAVCLQGLFDYHRPDAVRILDFAHACEYVAKAGQAVLGAESEAFKTWFEAQCHLMKHSNGDSLLEELQSLQKQAQANNTKEVLEQVQRSLSYLSERKPMLRYAHFRELGYPIGSGATESANKVVVEERLKGAGMHWASPHLNPMLALRNLSANLRWESGWQGINIEWSRQKQAQRQARGLARKVARLEALAELEQQPAGETRVETVVSIAISEAKTVEPLSESAAGTKVPYKPAPGHPWRKLAIGRAKYQINPNFVHAKN